MKVLSSNENDGKSWAVVVASENSTEKQMLERVNPDDGPCTGCCARLGTVVSNKICGFRAHFRAAPAADGARLLLTFWKVTWRVCGRSSSLQKKLVFLSKNVGNFFLMSNPFERKNGYCLFYKMCCETQVFSQFVFHRKGVF